MASVNVKIQTKKLITALEARVSENKRKIAEYEKAKELHEKATEKWEASVAKLAPKVAGSSGVIPSVSVSDGTHWRNPGKVSVEITYLIPEAEAAVLAAPTRSAILEEFGSHGYAMNDLHNQNREIENAVRILNLTDDEYVNTTTYKSVSKYL